MDLKDQQSLSRLLESLIFARDKPLSVDKLISLVEQVGPITRAEIKVSLAVLQQDYSARGVQLVEVASGFRFQTANDLNDAVSLLWEERPQKYSRALLETLALIAYRQPITRGEIEDVRGVAVSSHIIKTLLERQWVKVVGHREVPGRPAIYATTKLFLDYFNLKSVDQLPPLNEMRDIELIAKEVSRQLELGDLDGLDDAASESSPEST